MRLDKFLADMSIGTRSEVKKLIKDKRIKIDNKIITDSGYKVSNEDIVFIDDQPIDYVEYEYLLLYKPKGYLTTTQDSFQPIVMDLIDSRRKDLFPVGRLDKDTTGVLLITNDGQLAHNLLAPKKHILKRYKVNVSNRLPENAKELFLQPMEFEDFTSKPAQYEKIDDYNAFLTIHEGKYHQVKRMFEKIGCPVIELERVSFGNLTLEGLKPGEYRELTMLEIEELNKNSGESNG